MRFYAPEGAGGYLVEQIREIVSDVSYAPIQAKSKVYILDRVDMLGTAAANAFLKTLEEPPANVTVSYTHLDVYKRQLLTFDQEEYTFLPFTILYVRTLT